MASEVLESTAAKQLMDGRKSKLSTVDRLCSSSVVLKDTGNFMCPVFRYEYFVHKIIVDTF